MGGGGGAKVKVAEEGGVDALLRPVTAPVRRVSQSGLGRS